MSTSSGSVQNTIKKIIPAKELKNFKPELWDSLMLAAKLKDAGIIQSISRVNKNYPDEIKIPFHYHAKIYGAPGGLNGSGANLFNEEAALRAAIGEGLERYSMLNFLPKNGNFLDTSLEKIKDKALNILKIVGISPEERIARNSVFPLYFDEKTNFRWVKGYSITEEKPVFVPLQLVSYSWRPWREGKEPMLRMFSSTGAAVDSVTEKAILHGLLEIIERDTFFITWLNKLAPRKLGFQKIGDKKLQKIFDSFEEKLLELNLLLLPTDFPCYVILAIIIDRTGVGPAVSVGGTAALSLTEAVEKSISEAIKIRNQTRKMLERAREIQEDLSFDNPASIGIRARALLWARRGMENEIDFLLKGEEINPEDLKDFINPTTSPKEKLDHVIQSLKTGGLEASYVDITPDQAKESGLRSIFTIIPELQPMHIEEALPYFYGSRLHDVPIKLGYLPAKELNKIPHPFI